GERVPQRSVAVLQLAEPEGKERDPELALDHPSLDVRLLRADPALLLLLAPAGTLRLELLAPRLALGAFLHPDGRELRLELLLLLVEEVHHPLGDVEGIELRVGIGEEHFAERVLRLLGPGRLLQDQRDAEQPVCFRAEVLRLEVAGLDQLREALRGFRVLARVDIALGEADLLREVVDFGRRGSLGEESGGGKGEDCQVHLPSWASMVTTRPASSLFFRSLSPITKRRSSVGLRIGMSNRATSRTVPRGIKFPVSSSTR